MGILCFDIGGTDIKYGMIKKGKLLWSNSTPTEAFKGATDILEKLVTIINRIKIVEKIEGIALSTAGQVNPFTGEILYASDTIPKYRGKNPKKFIEKRVGLPTTIENDVNCALLAELKNYSVGGVVLFTIGTGIGGAIGLNGEIIRGDHFTAGEIGYMPVGIKTFQEIASTKALIDEVQKVTRKTNLTGYDVFELASKNKDVSLIVENFYTSLAKGFTNIILLLGCKHVVLGGAISQRDDLVDRIQKETKKFLPENIYENTHFHQAENGNLAGIIGAYEWFQQMNENKQNSY